MYYTDINIFWRSISIDIKTKSDLDDQDCEAFYRCKRCDIFSKSRKYLSLENFMFLIFLYVFYQILPFVEGGRGPDGLIRDRLFIINQVITTINNEGRSSKRETIFCKKNKYYTRENVYFTLIIHN